VADRVALVFEYNTAWSSVAKKGPKQACVE
jgi:hypothetical protein